MTIGDFCEAVAASAQANKGSVTSWGRTSKRERSLSGGIVGGPHSWWVGVDLTYDTGPNREGSQDHPQSPSHCPICSDDKLKLIHEKDHDHLQPQDFPAGSVLKYAYLSVQ